MRERESYEGNELERREEKIFYTGLEREREKRDSTYLYKGTSNSKQKHDKNR